MSGKRRHARLRVRTAQDWSVVLVCPYLIRSACPLILHTLGLCIYNCLCATLGMLALLCGQCNPRQLPLGSPESPLSSLVAVRTLQRRERLRACSI